MKIPKKLKIGNLIYKISELDDSDDTHFGKSTEREQWIRLSTQFSSEEKRVETLFHEIIHQILDRCSYVDESKDEKLIDCLANGLYQVLKENNLLK